MIHKMKRHKTIYSIIAALFAILFLLNADIIFAWMNYGSDYAGTLFHYRYIDHNSQKQDAAKFLVENAKYHRSYGRLQGNNKKAAQLRLMADSLYSNITSNGKKREVQRDSLNKVQSVMREFYGTIGYPKLSVEHTQYLNNEFLTSDFLIEHIDNAFDVWEASPFASNLSFDEFKEMILPYSSVQGMGFHETGKRLNDIYSKYIIDDADSTLVDVIRKYNNTLQDMRRFELFKPRKEPAGIYDLYSNGLHDCVEIAEYGSRILRSVGLPVVVEFNACYLDLIGRHYHCNVYNDSTDAWSTFNPETSLPGDGDWAFAHTMNMYRITYEPQKNTPFFLRNENEVIPSILGDPCIKDVTSNYVETASLTIPFTKDTENDLAYLATFNRDAYGMMPVTWGVIDKKNKQVTFEHLRENAIYIPVFYDGRNCVSFAEPFYIKIKDGNAIINEIPGINESAGTADMLITRKYPRKKNMITVAENLVGGKFLGANKPDFSDAVVLYEIKNAPQPYFLEYDFGNIGKFQYYRFQAPAENPNANISMLEWITSTAYGYENVAPASRPHILEPMEYVHDSTKVQLLDAPFGSSTWKSEYDGNMLTAPGAYPDITLRLKSKQVVTGARFAPLNADNGINSGDTYELYYWENGWKLHATVKAEYEYLKFKDVPQGRMYWLKNTTKGQEETPFVMVDGKQKFIYQDIIGWKH